MKRCFFLFITFLFVAYSGKAQYMIYGTTAGGGLFNKGTIFRYNPFLNQETLVFSFDGTNGQEPECTPLVVADSLLFGLTTREVAITMMVSHSSIVLITIRKTL